LAASSRTRIDQRSRGHGLRNDTGLDEEFLHPIDAVDRYRQGRIDLFVVDRLIGDEFSTLVVRLGVRHVMGDLDRLVAMKQYQLKAKPTAMGGPAANLTAVMSGQIDVGWAAAPFGLDQLDQNRSASLRPATMPTPSRVRRCELMPTIMKAHKDVVDRYMKAYREAVNYMYTDPNALKVYAHWLKISEAKAKRTRDDFFPRASVEPDKIVGLDNREGCGRLEFHGHGNDQGPA
jgi:hypothetical protein